MNNKLFLFPLTIIVIQLAPGCSKQDDKSTTEEGLVGTWQWVRTDGGLAFHIHDTPLSTGKNIDLKITSDGKYFIYTNGVLTSEGTYALEKKRCIHDHTDKTFVSFSADQDFMVEKLDNENLEISDEAHDGLGSSYKRKI